MLVHSLPMKSRKEMANNVTDTHATHTSLVHDVKDRLLDIKWQCSWSSFCDFQTADHKSTEKVLWVYFYSISIASTHNASSLGVPFNTRMNMHWTGLLRCIYICSIHCGGQSHWIGMHELPLNRKQSWSRSKRRSTSSMRASPQGLTDS